MISINCLLVFMSMLNGSHDKRHIAIIIIIIMLLRKSVSIFTIGNTKFFLILLK